MSTVPDDELVIGQRYTAELSDCCIEGQYTGILLSKQVEDDGEVTALSFDGLMLTNWGQVEFKAADGIATDDEVTCRTVTAEDVDRSATRDRQTIVCAEDVDPFLAELTSLMTDFNPDWVIAAVGPHHEVTKTTLYAWRSTRPPLPRWPRRRDDLVTDLRPTDNP